MNERVISIAPSDVPGRQALVRVLFPARRLTLAEASRWCDSWEVHAAGSGIRRSETPYFWDSARGWIDAQLDIEPTATSQTRTPTAARAGRRATARRPNNRDNANGVWRGPSACHRARGSGVSPRLPCDDDAR